MNRNTKIAFIGGIVVLMGILVALFSSGSGKKGVNGSSKKKKNAYVSANWDETYGIQDKYPRGLYLFNGLLKSHLNKGQNIIPVNQWNYLDSISSEGTGKKTYMFVGERFGLTNDEMDSILDDVARGSRLFMSFNHLTMNLNSSVFNYSTFHFDYGETVKIKNQRKKKYYNLINLYEADTIARDWKTFDQLDFDYQPEVLSTIEGYPNFIKVRYGKGYMYLQTTPEAFFNYQITRSSGYKNAAFTLNQLPKDQDVILLEFAKLSQKYGSDEYIDDEFLDGEEDHSYLKVIYDNRVLLIATILLFLGVILFLLFRSKRNRPAVDFIPKKKDMTLAFADTITSIYFSKRNPYGLLQVQRKNFYSTIHRHFFVDLNRRNEDREIKTLSEKSNVPFDEIQRLIQDFETKEVSKVNEQYIANMAKKRYDFYQHVGIISSKLNEQIEARSMVFRRAMLIPALLIFAGVSLIILGLYYLTQSTGIGIVFWPIGIILTVMGSLRLTKPYLEIHEDTIVYYPILFGKRTFQRENLTRTEMKQSGVVLHFNDSKQLIINYWDMSHFDKKQFEKFISKLHMLEL